MTCIPLELAKKHLNLDEEYTEDDEYILGLVAAAKGAVEMALNEIGRASCRERV